MYRLKDIIKPLKNVVGWEQTIDERLLPEITTSESGLYYQWAHPLLTLDNMASIMPEYAPNFAQWSATTAYNVGDKVKYHDVDWECVEACFNVMPPLSRQWKRWDNFSHFLDGMAERGIAQVVQTFLQDKSITKESKNLLEKRTFFDGSGRLQATLANNHKIVGMEITPVRAMGVTTKINRIGLQFVGGVGKVKFYLFHSSQVDPITTFELEYTKTNGGFQWFDVEDVYLPYVSDNSNSGGSWYLVYNQDELPSGMQAINVSKDWSREPCGTCNVGSIETWRELTKYIQISPMMVNAPTTFAEFPEMWDVIQTMYTNTQNYGINVEVSVGCDLTDFIIEQRDIFKSVIQKQVAYNALRTLAMNPNVRVNRNQSNASRMDILYELDGNTQGRESGLGYELKQAYKALKIDTQGIDRVCLTCNNHGVRYMAT